MDENQVIGENELVISLDNEFGRKLLSVLEKHDEVFGLDPEVRDFMESVEMGLATLGKPGN
ncbi:MAG: hypothetical protein WAQ98_11260 [Blastocatellia bacterium]